MAGERVKVDPEKVCPRVGFYNGSSVLVDGSRRGKIFGKKFAYKRDRKDDDER